MDGIIRITFWKSLVSEDPSLPAIQVKVLDMSHNEIEINTQGLQNSLAGLHEIKAEWWNSVNVLQECGLVQP